MANQDGKIAQRGKGANFDTRPNPFGGKVQTIAPEFGDVSETGLAIDAVLRAGCAIIFGHTRDGGAVCITILDGNDRHRSYCSNDQELDSAISALRSVYTEK
jgi:hypothetical protein